MIGEDKQKLPQEGGIAIDDVEFKDCAFGPGQGTCGAGNQQCSVSNVCYSNDYQCDFTNDCCGSGSDETACGKSYSSRLICICLLFVLHKIKRHRWICFLVRIC